MTPEAMKTPDPIDPLDSLLNRRSPAVVRPDFLDRVIAATVMEAQEKDEKIIEFPASHRHWVKVGSLAAAASVVLGIWLSMRPVDNQNIVQISPTQELVNDGLEQELVAVEDMQTMISLDDPSELDDAQLLSLLN